MNLYHSETNLLHVPFNSFIGYLDKPQFVSLNQIKGNNSCITNAILIKLDVHQHIKVTYISFMFFKLPVHSLAT